MRIPCISAFPTEEGFEAWVGIRLASLLTGDLLQESHYGSFEAKEDASFSKLNPRHLQHARELLLRAAAPLINAVLEIRITVQPDLLHKAQGSIGLHLLIRCPGASEKEAKERAVVTYLNLMPILAAYLPEADLKPVLDATELETCRSPFAALHASAVVHATHAARLSKPVPTVSLGFLPSLPSASDLEGESITSIASWVPSHDDWGRLLEVLTGQLDPTMLLVRLAPCPDVAGERQALERILERCETTLAGLEGSDLILRKQVAQLIDRASARLDALQHPCFNLAVLVVSDRPVAPALSHCIASAVSTACAVAAVEETEFMSLNFFPEKVPFTITEAASAFRFPSPPSREIAGLLVQRFRTSLAVLPPRLAGSSDTIHLFVNEHQGVTQEVCITPEDRMRHAFIVGQTGTGKSTLLESMIVQDIEAGRGVALIDPHGDLADNVLRRIPQERAGDVVLFDLLDRERPLAFNILQWRDLFERDLIIDELYRTLDHVYDMKLTGGPMFEQHFRNFLKLLMGDAPRQGFVPTILEFIRCYTDSEFRKWLLQGIKDRQVRDFVQEAEDAGGECTLKNIAPYVSSKFGRFVNDTALKRIVGQERSSIDFERIMNQGKILLVKLGKGRFGSEVSALLANMLVARFKFAAMKRGDRPHSQRRDFFLYVDEAHNLPRENFSELLAEARKFRLGLVLSTQYCAQLGSVTGGRGDDLLAAVFGNVGTLISFRTGTQDAEHLVKGFAPYFSQLDITSLPNFHGYARMNLGNQAMTPFSFRTELDRTPEDGGLAARIRSLSRLRFGNPAALVDEEIAQRCHAWKDGPSHPVESEELPGPTVVNLVVLDLVLADLEPSARLARALDAAGLRTVRDVVRCSQRFLKEDQEMAQASLRELKRRLAAIGCCLSEREVQLELPSFFDDYGHQGACG